MIAKISKNLLSSWGLADDTILRNQSIVRSPPPLTTIEFSETDLTELMAILSHQHPNLTRRIHCSKQQQPCDSTRQTKVSDP